MPLTGIGVSRRWPSEFGAAYTRAVAIEVEIDRDACMGSGNCVWEAVGVFELDDDGIATVADVTAAPEEKVLSAARNCPANAIAVRRDGVELA